MSLPTEVKKMDMISEGIKISLKCCVKDDCNKCNYRYSTCYRGLARDALEQIEVLEQIEELEPKALKWVSVKNRLPDKESMLCLVISDGDLYVSHWHWSNGGAWFFTDGECDCNVTHWAKAPELPKKEEA